MNVAQVIEMVQARRGNSSYEKYARQIGLSTGALYKLIKEAPNNPKREISPATVKAMIDYYYGQQDYEMTLALVQFATSLKPDQLATVLSL